MKVSYKRYLNTRVFYLSILAMAAIIAAGLFLTSDDITALAQKGDVASRSDSKGAKVARADMLAVALDFGSAEQYTVFGAKGVRSDGASISGKSGSGADEASLGENGIGIKSRTGLTKALAMIKQLPCNDLDAEMNGGTFVPGVYCAPSAALAGQMVLNGGGDTSSTFVFRIDGTLKTADGFQMSLENGAKAGNVYFVADAASIGAWGSLTGNVIARGTINVGAGTSLKGRAFSKEGEVVVGDAANVALAPGYIQICKNALHDGIATTGPGGFDAYTSTTDLSDDQNSLRYRIFQFEVGGVIYEVPTGSCSAPILVSDANATVTELIDGYYVNRPDRTLPSGTWFNRFRLVDVSARTTTGAPVPSLTTNLSARTTTFAMPTTTENDPVILTFTNTFAIPGVIEICKYPSTVTTTGGSPSVEVLDTSVSGFFDFTVNTNINPDGTPVVYTVPVNFCTGPIQVLVPTTPQDAPGTAVVYVTELGEAGFTLEGAAVLPGDNAVADRTVVTPANLAPGGRWYPADTRAPGTGFFQNGPGTPPLGTGSFRLNTPDAASKVQLFTDLYDGVRLADITGIGYSTYKDPISADGPATTAMNLRVDLTGDGIPDAYMVFEPYQDQGNAAIVEGVWQNWDAYRGGAALWWLNTGVPACSQATPCTWNQILAIVPNATIEEGPNCGPGGVTVPCPGSLGVNQGSGNPNTYTNADALYVEVSGNRTTFDFELTGTSSTFLRLNEGLQSSIRCMTVPEGTAIPANCFFVNPGGGVVAATINEATDPSNQTIFQFFNRTNPGVIKVCKIAGRGVPIGTEFEFIVRGRQAQFQADGTGNLILPGVDIERRVVVPAGPANQGGFCEIVSEDPDGTGPLTTGGANTLFVVGTLAYVEEVAVLDDVPGVEDGGFGDLDGVNANDGPDTTPNTEVRVSRISVNGVDGANVTGTRTVQGQTLGADSTDPNPDLFSPADGDLERRVIFRVGRGETVVTFANRLFSPTQLKICKVAGTGIAIGTEFTFNITIDTEGGLVPGQTNEPITVASVVIPAGDGTQSAQGNCVVVSGPYEAPLIGDASGVTPNPPTTFGTFDVGSTITVAETGSPSSVVITSPTGPATALTVDAANRRANLVLGYPGGFNELIFVNSSAAPVSTGFSLAGRVMTPDGGGLRNAQVILTKPDGTRMTVPTSSMGYYSFSGLANETYTVSVSSRRYRFTARSVDLNASLANVDFNGIE